MGFGRVGTIVVIFLGTAEVGVVGACGGRGGVGGCASVVPKPVNVHFGGDATGKTGETGYACDDKHGNHRLVF